MNAKDIMTAPVISVSPATGVRQIVAILLQHRISGVMVVDDGEVVGSVGHGDLLHRHEIGTDTGPGDRPWWKRLTEADPAPAAYVKSHGGRADDVMNHELVSIAEDAPIATVAAIFEVRRIRRIPVLRGRELVGIVTRGDLVRALAANVEVLPRQQDDGVIAGQLRQELARQSWWNDKWSSVFVRQGVVRYVGMFVRETDRQAARIAAENIAGVLRVEDHRVQYEEWQSLV